MTQNDTELVTIATNNRTSNASTVSVKASATKAITNSLERSSEQPSLQNRSQKEDVDGKGSGKNFLTFPLNSYANLASLACLSTTASTAINVSGKLQGIIDKLSSQNG